MARMIPQFFDERRTPPGEKMVFRALRKAPDEWIVLHQVHLATEPGEPKTELDFVIIMPQFGFVVAEVKSHSTISFDESGWRLGQSVQARSPFEQADDGLMSLIRRLIKKVPTLSSASFQRCVFFPFARFDARSVSWHDWEWLDRNRFSSTASSAALQAWLEQCVLMSHRAQYESARRPRGLPQTPRAITSSEIQSAVSWLRPMIRSATPEREMLSLRRQAIATLTHQQCEVIQALEDNPRILIRGPAGTGKTVLALEMTRRWSEIAGLRPLLLCYNRLLADSLARQLSGIIPEGCVDTIHGLMLRCSGMNVPSLGADHTFWRDTLPQVAAERILDGHRAVGPVDCLVLDEAQDIITNPLYIEFLEYLLDDQIQRSRWAIFGDFESQLFYAESSSLKSMLSRLTHMDGVKCCAEYSLRHNCRNTREIGTAAVTYSGLPSSTYQGFLRSDGSPQDVELASYETEDELLIHLRGAIDRMRHSGLESNQIALLSLLPITSTLRQQLESLLGARSWTQRGRAVGYETVQRFKGLEADGVVLFNIRDASSVPLRDLLYVGCTRATMKMTMLVHESVKEWLLSQVVTV